MARIEAPRHTRGILRAVREEHVITSKQGSPS